MGGQCTIYDKTSRWQLQNSGHWCTQLYFKMYTITARKDKWFFSWHCMGKKNRTGLNVNKNITSLWQLLATEISVFTGTTVGTSHLWTKICLKITMRFKGFFLFPFVFAGTWCALHSWQFYILHTNCWNRYCIQFKDHVHSTWGSCIIW